MLYSVFPIRSEYGNTCHDEMEMRLPSAHEGAFTMDTNTQDQPIPVEISERDIIDAMKSIQGYLDITPGDFKEVFQAAYALALKRLLDTLKAEDLMSKPVQTVRQEMELVQAAALLARKNISGAPVVDDTGGIVGIVSEKDFLKEMGFGATPSFMQIANHCLNDKSCMIGKLRKRTVADIMTKPAIAAGPELTVGKISDLFAEKRINRLPIIAKDGQPLGIVTRTDLAHSYSIFGRRLRP
jgi:CBS domain-containing membrane protein